MAEKRRSGGLNEADRLKSKGFDVRKTTRSRVWIGDFHVVTTGPLAHPRWTLPIDTELADVIRREGIPGDFEARETDKLEIIDGARRLKAALAVEAELQKVKPRQPPLTWNRDDENDPGRLYVDTELVHCDDAELLLRRLRANRGGLPDAPSVLAAIVIGLAKVGHEDTSAVVAVMPRGIGPADVQALARWGGLVKELRPRFDSGELPLGILGAVLDTARDEQVTKAESLKAAGIRTAKGATRRANGERAKADPWARRMTPKQAVRLGVCVLDGASEVYNDADASDAARAFVAGLHVAANHDVKAALRTLPKPLADVIREARAGKPAKA